MNNTKSQHVWPYPTGTTAELRREAPIYPVNAEAFKEQIRIYGENLLQEQLKRLMSTGNKSVDADTAKRLYGKD